MKWVVFRSALLNLKNTKTLIFSLQIYLSGNDFKFKMQNDVGIKHCSNFILQCFIKEFLSQYNFLFISQVK